MREAGISRFGRYLHSAPFVIVLILLITAFAAGGVWASGGGHGEAKGWMATDTYKVMNFAVLIAILIFVMKKPVSNALSGRIQDIKKQLETLEEQKAGAEKELAGYQEKLATLENEAQTIMDEYVRQGQEAKARILEEAEKTAEKLQLQAQRSIAQEFERAGAQLRAEIIEKAMAQAEAAIKKGIADEDQDKLVDEYLQKVVA